MPYITINVEPRTRQITFDDIFNGCTEDIFLPKRNTKNTRTWYTKYIDKKLLDRTDFAMMYGSLVSFNRKYNHLIQVEDKSTLYYSFKIPKRSGGLRNIDAPEDELMIALRELKDILEMRFYASYHTSAFAYVKGRSALTSVQRHQKNESKWFLKLDFSKFFPSTTPEFLTNMLCQTYPLSEYVKIGKDFKDELDKALSLCFLNGGLPQGTPTSPMLTNMMMIPIDYAISKMCREHPYHLCYTRYADDILISSKKKFESEEVQNQIIKILKDFNAPFVLNTKKTRYGSSNGRNWNLGVMLNKDNEITIGNERKKVFKAMVFQFMADYEKGNLWQAEDIQHLLGLTSYYRMVEPKRIEEILDAQSKKFGKDVIETAKRLVSV